MYHFSWIIPHFKSSYKVLALAKTASVYMSVNLMLCNKEKSPYTQVNYPGYSSLQKLQAGDKLLLLFSFILSCFGFPVLVLWHWQSHISVLSSIPICYYPNVTDAYQSINKSRLYLSHAMLHIHVTCSETGLQASLPYPVFLILATLPHFLILLPLLLLTGCFPLYNFCLNRFLWYTLEH